MTAETPLTDRAAFWTPCLDDPKLAEVVMADEMRALERRFLALVDALEKGYLK